MVDGIGGDDGRPSGAARSAFARLSEMGAPAASPRRAPQPVVSPYRTAPPVTSDDAAAPAAPSSDAGGAAVLLAAADAAVLLDGERTAARLGGGDRTSPPTRRALREAERATRSGRRGAAEQRQAGHAHAADGHHAAGHAHAAGRPRAAGHAVVDHAVASHAATSDHAAAGHAATSDHAAAGRRAASGRGVRRPAMVAARAAVLALLVIGTTGYATLHKEMVVDVDGVPVQVAAFARTVGDILDAGGVDVAAGASVLPDPASPAIDGGEIVVRSAKEITLEIDGTEETIWTTAQTVGEALEVLGDRVEGAMVSASRAAEISRTPLLRVSTLKNVSVVVDGEVIEGLTNAPTVREALREIGVVLGDNDVVSVPLDTTAVDGLAVLVSRAVSVDGTETITRPFETYREDDATLLVGTEVVTQRGRAGTTVVTYTVDSVGGAEVERTVLTEVVLSEPVAQVIKVGTMPLPAVTAVAAVEPGTARAIGKELAAARGWGDEEFACLDNLWTRESGWNAAAENRSSGAYGIPQALPGSKMATAGADWRTNPSTQITWGLGYIAGRYSTPCGAWGHFLEKHWY